MQDLLRFSELPDYAFPRLRALLKNIKAPVSEVPMHIGEPTHSFPTFINEKIIENSLGFNSYPPNDGTPGLLSSISHWISKRFKIPRLDFEKNIISLNGTREGLFNATIALSPTSKNGKNPAILIPNPFYQCYMVAAKAVGAEPIFVPATIENGFLPDFSRLPKTILERTTICYICSPSNPQGAIASKTYWKNLLSLAETYDFKILADECYSEIYKDKKPNGAIESLYELNMDSERLIIFNSLSKRSNLPGLRSGFAASGEKTIAELKKLKAYSGSPSPSPLQFAAEAAWRDEIHVVDNRRQYNEKLNMANKIFKRISDYQPPEAGFFLWLKVNNGEIAATELWKKFGVKVLPGAYLSNYNHKTFGRTNPGENYIRVALVRPMHELEFGLKAISQYLN
ncbi:MAG: aminotransferase class I/II-fold pyridoxal phosphate-dependent enzyme [Paracoccaceae bacterium]|nr:aminotransferase class I/II-fold pyridoxal phosphate-dependent enzyme [Paracoccaceae bacterium]